MLPAGPAPITIASYLVSCALTASVYQRKQPPTLPEALMPGGRRYCGRLLVERDDRRRQQHDLRAEARQEEQIADSAVQRVEHEAQHQAHG